ncbi:hypothetical protein ACLOJK_033697 [Asimina triloba]
MAFYRAKRHHKPLKLPPSNPHFQFLIPPSSPNSHPLPPSPDSPGVDALSDLEKLAVIGHGEGVIVYKVRHRWTSAVFALKVLRVPAAREADILRRVADSPFIVRCHTIFSGGGDDGGGGGGGGNLCFLMEYMGRGSLQDVLRARKRLSEKQISYVARQVLEGLSYLHGLRIVHRDIKPSNLLINDEGEVKIADFGVSREVGPGMNGCCSSYVGTCAYMSPERFDPGRCQGQQYNGFAGDVWALGVALLECHVGHFPLISPGERADWATLMWAICFGEPPEMTEAAASVEFRDFVGRCLEKDWRKRGSVQELLSHPFLDTCSSKGLVDEDEES